MHELVVFLLLLLLGQSWAQQSALSANELEMILEGEDHLLIDLQLYIDALEHKLNIMRTFVQDSDERWQQAQPNLEAYVGNVLNGFPLMRRMHTDAPKLFSYLNHDAGQEGQQKITEYNLDVLQDEDLDRVAEALLREQKINNLNARHMAQNRLPGREYNTTMSTLDCLSLARYLRKRNDLQMARKWLQVALEQYDQTPEVLHKLMKVDRLSILQELSEIQLNK